MAGQARSGFAMDIVGQSSRPSSFATTSRPPSHLSKRHDAFREDDEDDEDDHLQRLHGNGHSSRGHTNGKGLPRADELLSGYSQSKGAEKIRKSPPRQGPRVIAKQEDLNWMEERKRRLGLERYREQLGSLTSMRPPGSSTTSQSAAEDVKMAAAERIGDEKQLSGLQIQKKTLTREEEEMEEIRRLQERANEDNTPPASQAGQSPVLQAQNKEETEDEAARRALLSGQGLGAAFRIDEERIIPISEEEALKRDTDTRPEPPSLSDYAKMPVEEFGAALLRGMGWKEGTGAGKNKQGPTSAPEVKKRAALLGLGAKERKTDDDQQMGVKAKNFKIERPERRYIPVARVERERGSESRPRAIEEGRRRERSRSPPRKRDRDEDYNRRDDRQRRERPDREYSDDYEREIERRRRRERERERERPSYSGGSSDRR
jgi:hypothetical protein